MSSLKERIDNKSRALVRREVITLPETQERVQVRGQMTGESLRVSAIGNTEKSTLTAIANACEDPETGQPIWNPNNLKDLDAIGRLHPKDATAIAQAIERLSGLTETPEELLGKSEETENSSTSSAPDSDVPHPNLAAA